MDHWVLAAIAILCGGFVQGVTGFGMGLVSVPLLALIIPERLPQVLIALMIPATLWQTVKERESLRLRSIGWVAAGRMIGTVPGVLLVQALSERSLQALFAVATILAVVTMAASSIQIPISSRTQLGAGILSGVMTTSSSLGGPPLVLLYAHRPGPEVRAMIGGVVFLGNFASLAGLGLAGRLAGQDIVLAIALLAPMFGGLVGGRRVVPWVDRTRFRAAVLVVVLATSVALLVRSIV